MACEDFPCCGHDICPSFDREGKQLNMVCVCGQELPVNSFSSMCRNCIRTDGNWDPVQDEFLGGKEFPDFFYEDGW